MRSKLFPSVTTTVPRAGQNMTSPESIVPSADEDTMFFGELAILHPHPFLSSIITLTLSTRF